MSQKKTKRPVAKKAAPRAGYYDAERIADTLDSIDRTLKRFWRHRDATSFTQAELDELYNSSTSNAQANDKLQAKLREAMKRTEGP